MAFHEYPYTDFHEMNLDWVIKKVKELADAWVQVQSDWQDEQAAFQTLKSWVENYFNNLNVQQEINVKLDALVLNGTMSNLIAPYVASGLPAVVAAQLSDVVSAQIGAVVAAQIGAVVADQLPAIAASAAATEVSSWLEAHVDPDTGYVIDDSLTVQGAAADAKATGDQITDLNSALSEILDPDYGLGAYYASKALVNSGDTSGVISATNNVIGFTSSLNTNKYVYVPLRGLKARTTYELEIKTDSSKVNAITVNVNTTPTGSGNTQFTFDNDSGTYTLELFSSSIGIMSLVISLKSSTMSLDAEISIKEKGKTNIKDNLIAADNLSSELANRINARKGLVYSGVAYASSRIISGISVGDTFSVESYQYANIKLAVIPPGAKGMFVSGEDITNRAYYCVCDKDDKVLKVSGSVTAISQSTNFGYYVSLEGITDPAYLYYTSISTINTGVCFADFGNEVICEGDNYDGTVTGATLMYYKEHGFNVYETDGTSVVTITTSSKYIARSVGVWIRIASDEDADKLRYINFELYNDSTLIKTGENVLSGVFRCGEWILVKFFADDKAFNKIIITPTLVSALNTAHVLISGGVVINHFVRPTYIIDFDQAWQATEDSGAYDLLINNGIPFTITGTLDGVDSATKTKLLNAWKNGLLDVGSYGGEFIGHSVDVNTEYQTLLDNANYCIEQKSGESGCPTSFGPGNHLASEKLVRALKESGYTCIKNGSSGWNQSVISADRSLVSLVTNPFSAMNTGSYCLFFWHGISSDPSQESDPSMYASYSDFEALINKVIRFRQEGGIKVMNMKQYAEYVNELK